jgi:hypothetical protein
VAWVDAGSRWWGVKVWKTWSINDERSHVEEAVYLVRAESEDKAAEAGWASAVRADDDFTNEHGETVTIRASHVDHVYDLHVARLRSGGEVFSLLYELDDEGAINTEHPGTQ